MSFREFISESKFTFSISKKIKAALDKEEDYKNYKINSDKNYDIFSNIGDEDIVIMVSHDTIHILDEGETEQEEFFKHTELKKALAYLYDII